MPTSQAKTPPIIRPMTALRPLAPSSSKMSAMNMVIVWCLGQQIGYAAGETRQNIIASHRGVFMEYAAFVYVAIGGQRPILRSDHPNEPYSFGEVLDQLGANLFRGIAR